MFVWKCGQCSWREREQQGDCEFEGLSCQPVEVGKSDDASLWVRVRVIRIPRPGSTVQAHKDPQARLDCSSSWGSLGQAWTFNLLEMQLLWRHGCRRTTRTTRLTGTIHFWAGATWAAAETANISPLICPSQVEGISWPPGKFPAFIPWRERATNHRPEWAKLTHLRDVIIIIILLHAVWLFFRWPRGTKCPCWLVSQGCQNADLRMRARVCHFRRARVCVACASGFFLMPKQFYTVTFLSQDE